MKIQLNHHEALSDARLCPIVFAEVLEIQLESKLSVFSLL
jgi:hypothetical protein